MRQTCRTWLWPPEFFGPGPVLISGDTSATASDYRLRGTSDGAYIPNAEIEIGGRVWYSSGRYQKDLGATVNQAQQDLLVSRLTYDTTSASGEVYGRIDTSSNPFLKGFIGGGSHLSGKMHDEDWLIFGAAVPYSNTLSNPVKGDLAYATDMAELKNAKRYSIWRLSMSTPMPSSRI